MCTLNEDHVMYGLWDIKAQQTDFVNLGHFLLSDPRNNLKNPNFEKMKIKCQKIL